MLDLTRQSRASIALGATLLASIALPNARGDDYQVHGMYLGSAPSGETNWSDAAYGLAHDDDHWYIVQSGDGFTGIDSAYLWRIPVSVNLATVTATTPGVSRVRGTDVLGVDGIVFGDPVVFSYNGVDYLLAPEGFGLNSLTYLAVFNADTLVFIRHSPWPSPQPDASSIATDPQGLIYAASGNPLRTYTVDWIALEQVGQLFIQYAGEVTLYDESGLVPVALGFTRGLEFTPDGRYLYVVANDIHVFDTVTWRRVLHSTNGSGHFNFAWRTPDENPGGVTIWDLDSISSPYEGRLHVIVRDSDAFDADDVILKHYTMSIRVRAGAPPPGTGSPTQPFPTVTAAVNLAWSGSEIRIINGGVFDESLTINKRVRVVARGATARIGG
ncbi:MAG: hypothetical protein ACKVS9_05035 [Phycisphaerae bacterium]